MRRTSFPVGKRWRGAVLATAALILLAGSALEAAPQRRVFTNDDIPSARPVPAPAPATPGDPAAESQLAAAAAELTVAADDEVSRISAMVEAMAQAGDLLYDKMSTGGVDEFTVERWNQMRDTLAGIATEFQRFLAEAEARADAEREAAAEGVAGGP